MNSQNRLVLIMAAGVFVPLLVGIHLYRNQDTIDKDSLKTSMDVEAVAEVAGEPTGTVTVDTIEDEAFVPLKGEAEESHKRKAVVALVEDGLKFIQANPFDTAMNAITHGRDFIRGELYLFVYDTTGVQFATGIDERFVWRNSYNLRDSFGTYLVQELIKKAKAGGGWVTYQWRNSTKVSYVKAFTKDGRDFILGAGYYPHAKRDIVVGLVRAAVAYFNEVVIEKGFLVDEVFSTLSYPAGRFVMGDLYLYAVDFDGQMMANGDRPGLIGTNVMNVTDSEGKFVNQEIINRLKKSTQGIWVEYKSKNTVKLTYAEKVTDTTGRQYFIACGYYPTVTPERAVDLVKDGYEFMKKHGVTAAVNEFSTRQTDSYRYGDLYLVVWDMKGKVIANGANLDAIGTNQYDLKDEDGRFFVRELIEKARQGGGWIDVKLKNAFQSIYVEKVDLGTESFVIGSGLYPISKREVAILLARSAAGFLRSHSMEEAFRAFSDQNGKFIRGDLYVFVIDFQGIAMVWGDSFELIWRNILGAKDDTGKPYIQMFINTVKQGTGQVTYRINGEERVALLEMVEKDGKNYVVGTAYFP